MTPRPMKPRIPLDPQPHIPRRQLLVAAIGCLVVAGLAAAVLVEVLR
jgi:hypothetical protein